MKSFPRIHFEGKGNDEVDEKKQQERRRVEQLTYDQLGLSLRQGESTCHLYIYVYIYIDTMRW